MAGIRCKIRILQPPRASSSNPIHTKHDNSPRCGSKAPVSKSVAVTMLQADRQPFSFCRIHTQDVVLRTSKIKKINIGLVPHSHGTIASFGHRSDAILLSLHPSQVHINLWASSYIQINLAPISLQFRLSFASTSFY